MSQGTDEAWLVFHACAYALLLLHLALSRSVPATTKGIGDEPPLRVDSRSTNHLRKDS